MTRRGRIVAAVLLIGCIAVVGRLVQLQILQHGHWQTVAASVQERTIELPPRRGAILDRDGNLLAFDVKAIAIAVDGYNMTKPATLVAILGEELDRPTGEIEDLVYRASYFTWIDRRVDLDTAQRIERRADEAGIHGLIFLDTWKRRYPQGSLASNLLGFVGTDGEGLEGLELQFDETLSGIPTRLHVLEGADGRTYDVEVLDEGTPGEDLALTIDAEFQFICEEEIARGVDRFQADAGMMIVLDPRTGEILAMAQDKVYDLNRFWTSTGAQRQNLAVTYQFEPGSVFKVFAGLAALQLDLVTIGETFDGDDGILVGGHVMHNSDNHSFGTVTFAEIIEESVNTGMIQVAQRVGADALRDTLARLGFGAVTGIELPGEIPGILRPAAAWTDLDLAASSIGQSVAVTGVQLAAALGAVANDGRWIAPSIVAGSQKATASTGIGAEACATMRDLMRLVVKSGTGTYAAIDGFDIAGKTGTAQKATPGRGYVDGKYTSLFTGMLSAATPEYVVLVVLDEVKTTPVWGGYTAGQIFRDATERMIHAERIAPTFGP